MKNIDTIRTGYGLGTLCFGSTREECREYLGDPEEELTEAIGDEEYITWHYWSDQISVYFDESEDFRLGTITIERPTANLNGDRLMGKSIQQIEDYLKEKGWLYLNDSIYKDEDGDIHRLIEVDEIQCNFLFTNNILEGIQWSFLWVDDETPDWPKQA